MVKTITGYSPHGKEVAALMKWGFKFPFRAVLLNDNCIHTPVGRSISLIYFITQ